MMIFDFLMFLLSVYEFVFFIYILLTWLPINPDNPIIRFITTLIAPVYGYLMRKLPPLRLGMFDFSPLYFFLAIFLARLVLTGLLELFISIA